VHAVCTDHVSNVSECASSCQAADDRAALAAHRRRRQLQARRGGTYAQQKQPQTHHQRLLAAAASNTTNTSDSHASTGEEGCAMFDFNNETHTCCTYPEVASGLPILHHYEHAADAHASSEHASTHWSRYAPRGGPSSPTRVCSLTGYNNIIFLRYTHHLILDMSWMGGEGRPTQTQTQTPTITTAH
jgi:hypothetical protein